MIYILRGLLILALIVAFCTGFVLGLYWVMDEAFANQNRIPAYIVLWLVIIGFSYLLGREW